MSRGSLHVTDTCRPATELFQLIGDKWTMFVVLQLRDGSLRFSEIRRAIPNISQRMLTLSLRNLERDGLVKRTVTPSVPPRVDYELTTLGRSFCERVAVVGMWAFENRDAVNAARDVFDARPPASPAASPATPAADFPAVAASYPAD